MTSELRTERLDTTLVLTLSDPANRNTLSPQACAAGIEALNTAADDDTLRAVVLRGDGAHFCAGLPPAARDGAEAAAALDGLHGLAEALRACPKPVIAAVEGQAAGGALVLLLACDLIVAADDARLLPSREAADGSAAAAFAERLPRPLALQWRWLPESVTAAQWHGAGWINAVVPPGQARAEALRWAQSLAALPPAWLARTKEALPSPGDRR